MKSNVTDFLNLILKIQPFKHLECEEFIQSELKKNLIEEKPVNNMFSYKSVEYEIKTKTKHAN